MKQFYLIYKTTNLINNKVYIGRHSTNDLNDRYLGSGTEFLEDLKVYGRKNFKREILYNFKTWKEMVDKETELLTEEFVNREDTYNMTRQGCGLITHTEEVRQVIREANLGLVSVKDKDGNNLKVRTDDPRYISGELKHNTHGTIVVKDQEGNRFRVPVDDPRRLSGELVGFNKGVKQTPERIENRVKKNLDWWEKNSHTPEGLEKMREVNKGKVNVVDLEGNRFRVSVNDERYTSGELKCAFIGTKLSKSACKKISENKKDCVWISNVDIRKTKLIKPDLIQSYLDEGWIKYRLLFNKPDWKIKLNKFLEMQNK